MLRLDKLKVDRVHQGPDLPARLAGREKIHSDLVSNSSKGVSIDETEVGEEDGHENGAPADLVNCYFGRHVLGRLSWDLLVEPSVKVVSRWTVVEKTKGRQRDESLPVKGAAAEEQLLL